MTRALLDYIFQVPGHTIRKEADKGVPEVVSRIKQSYGTIEAVCE